ncbi:Uncharacterized conserved protein [Phaffia rhodozyma]|uniref:Uncharacterized conserved protein n=1 Tax=Phaffia rhodozyma TaxID=264483 RepID=A0A0F7STY0_PHARH|nr:Uncharacterized conserved protein [Phaffia rhodozyma]
MAIPDSTSNSRASGLMDSTTAVSSDTTPVVSQTKTLLPPSYLRRIPVPSLSPSLDNMSALATQSHSDTYPDIDLNTLGRPVSSLVHTPSAGSRTPASLYADFIPMSNPMAGRSGSPSYDRQAQTPSPAFMSSPTMSHRLAPDAPSDEMHPTYPPSPTLQDFAALKSSSPNGAPNKKLSGFIYQKKMRSGQSDSASSESIQNAGSAGPLNPEDTSTLLRNTSQNSYGTNGTHRATSTSSKSSKQKLPNVEPFTKYNIPSATKLIEAGECEILSELGESVKFSDILAEEKGWKTAVFFIRHFWCGQCQNFMSNSILQLDINVLRRNRIKVIIISNGHWQIIKKYRHLFHCPFPIYVDGPRKLYNRLGMTKLTNDFGPLAQSKRSAYNRDTVPIQLAKGIGNGLFRLPLRDMGKLVQLGGEFVFDDTKTCTFAHRMTNTSDHMEAVDLVAEAGVDPAEFTCLLTPRARRVELPAATSSSGGQADRPEEKPNMKLTLDIQSGGFASEFENEPGWQDRRQDELSRIRAKREERRAGRLRSAKAWTAPADITPGEFDHVHIPRLTPTPSEKSAADEFQAGEPARQAELMAIALAIAEEEEEDERIRNEDLERVRVWSEEEQDAYLGRAIVVDVTSEAGSEGQSGEKTRARLDSMTIGSEMGSSVDGGSSYHPETRSARFLSVGGDSFSSGAY